MKTSLAYLFIVCFLIPSVQGSAQESPNISIRLIVSPSFNKGINVNINYDGKNCIISEKDYIVQPRDIDLKYYLDNLVVSTEKIFKNGFTQVNLHGVLVTDGTSVFLEIKRNDSVLTTSFHCSTIESRATEYDLIEAIYSIIFNIHYTKNAWYKMTDNELYDFELTETNVLRKSIREVSENPRYYKLHERVYNEEPVLELFNSFSSSDTLIIEVGRFFTIGKNDEFYTPFTEDIVKRDNIKWILCEENRHYLIELGIPEENVFLIKRALKLEDDERLKMEPLKPTYDFRKREIQVLGR